MATIAAPLIDWVGGAAPQSQALLVPLIDIEATSHLMQPAPLVAPSFGQLISDAGVGYAS